MCNQNWLLIPPLTPPPPSPSPAHQIISGSHPFPNALGKNSGSVHEHVTSDNVVDIIMLRTPSDDAARDEELVPAGENLHEAEV